jgi:hypothetical protein
MTTVAHAEKYLLTIRALTSDWSCRSSKNFSDFILLPPLCSIQNRTKKEHLQFHYPSCGESLPLPATTSSVSVTPSSGESPATPPLNCRSVPLRVFFAPDRRLTLLSELMPAATACKVADCLAAMQATASVPQPTEAAAQATSFFMTRLLSPHGIVKTCFII